ncbi:MAG: endonuclease domain-containing protein [Candidatus Pacebacteria bacterium]|nr:endonuclease domain-containing protein [Candidatus Paceibacterota bacterium]
MRKIIPYDPKLKQIAKNLRNNSTLSEVLLWQHLKGKKMNGYDFHRQKPIARYIVDFFCNELMLVIEIDEISHDDKINKDMKRQKQIENFGISFLRFNDIDVKKNMEGVVVAIGEWIDRYSSNTPQPLSRGE